VREGVDHDVEDYCRHDPVPGDYGEVGLSLPAEADCALAFVTADVFAEGWVFDENAQGEQA